MRPKNAAVYFGSARPYEYNAEMPRYHEMIRLTEEVIYEICSDPEIKFFGNTQTISTTYGTG